MNKKQLTTSLLVGTMGVTAVAGAAFGAEGYSKGHTYRAQLSEEVRTELKATFESGDYDAYVEVATNNNLERVMSEERFEKKVERHADKTAAKDAVLDGNYDEWRSIVGDERGRDITEENFYLLTDMAEARESGDEDAINEAKQALKDAGIKKPGHKGRKGKRGEGRGFDINLRNADTL